MKAAPANHSETPDRSALTDLYEDHCEELSAYLRKAFGDGPPDPDDVAQEAFQRLLEKNSLSGIDNLRAFLWRTARNLALTHKRNVETRSKFDFEIEHLFFAIEGAASSPERVLEVKEQLRIIDDALEKMPERRRKAFLWHRVDRLTFMEVGKRLGINRRAASRHVVRAAVQIEAALRRAMERRD